MPLLLTKEDVVRVLDMRDCMDVVEKAFAELASGTAVLPLRIGIASAGRCISVHARLS